MLGLALFIILANGVAVGVIQLSQLLLGAPELNFLSDYFFYSLLAQWGVGTVFMVSPPSNIKHLKHSPAKATRLAASLSDDSKDDKHHSSVDISLSAKLFISGAFSLLACFVI